MSGMFYFHLCFSSPFHPFFFSFFFLFFFLCFFLLFFVVVLVVVLWVFYFVLLFLFISSEYHRKETWIRLCFLACSLFCSLLHAGTTRFYLSSEPSFRFCVFV